jgi:hypothetical protein
MPEQAAAQNFQEELKVLEEKMNRRMNTLEDQYQEAIEKMKAELYGLLHAKLVDALKHTPGITEELQSQILQKMSLSPTQPMESQSSTSRVPIEVETKETERDFETVSHRKAQRKTAVPKEGNLTLPKHKEKPRKELLPLDRFPWQETSFEWMSETHCPAGYDSNSPLTCPIPSCRQKILNWNGFTKHRRSCAEAAKDFKKSQSIRRVVKSATPRTNQQKILFVRAPTITTVSTSVVSRSTSSDGTLSLTGMDPSDPDRSIA